tara:strand:+ start:509 stop:1690 length:1182 start_codon:yes stop_codon:yes gene_type:complete
MAINEILSTYRQALQTERQFELSQMQLALGMLESESNKQFRDESRRREDMWRGLTASRTATQEQMKQGYNSIYTNFLRMPFVQMKEKDGKMVPKISHSGASRRGFTDIQISDIETMMVLHSNGQTEQAEQLIAKMAREAYGEYDYWKEVLSDRDPEMEQLPQYIMAMRDSGIIDFSDENREKISIAPFRDISKGYEVLNNIASEFTEMIEGDYNLEAGRDVSISPLKEGYDTEEAKGIISSLDNLDIGGMADVVQGELGGKGHDVQKDFSKASTDMDVLNKQITDLRNEKKKLSPQYLLEDEERTDQINNEIAGLINQKNEQAGSLRYLESQSRFDVKEKQLEKLALEMGGTPAARAKAARMTRGASIDQYDERTGYTGGNRPAYDQYGAIKR